MGKLKLKASTLLEGLVAIIIVLMAFVMGIMIYLSVMSSDNGFQKLKAASLVQKMIYDTKINDSYVDSRAIIDSITIIKSIHPCLNAQAAIQFSVKAMDNKGRLLASYSEIVKQ
jgi:ABC-type lipoprotein release transport system permease subunit